jgi:predicted nucleic acid-binding protein
VTPGDPLPATIYLETSTVVAALVVGAKHHARSRAFCADLAARGSTAYYSQLLLLELAQAFRNLVVRRPPQLPETIRNQHQLEQWAQSGEVRQAWLAFGHAQLESFLDQFRQTVELPIRLRQESLSHCHTLMVRYDLKSYDAYHLVTANEYGLNDFATADREFQNVKMPRVWLTRD